MFKAFLAMLAWLLSASVALAAVNVNTATKEQLDALKGIGPTKAQAIIDYRTKNGPFKSIDDLEKVPGIGPATLKEIRGDVTLTGATTGPAASAEQKKNASAATGSDPKGAPKKDDAKATAKSEPKKDAAKTDEKKAAVKSSDTKATAATVEKSAAGKADDKKAGAKDDSRKDTKATKDEKK